MEPLTPLGKLPSRPHASPLRATPLALQATPLAPQFPGMLGSEDWAFGSAVDKGSDSSEDGHRRLWTTEKDTEAAAGVTVSRAMVALPRALGSDVCLASAGTRD